MRRLLSMAVIFSLLSIMTMAQKQWVGFNSDTPQLPQLELEEQDQSRVVIEVSIPGMYVTTVTEDDKTFQRLELVENRTTKDVGRPELPMISELIGIPNNQLVSVNILEKETIKLENYTVYPFQTPTTDNPGGYDHEFVMDQKYYNTGNVYPVNQVTMDKPGVWRDAKVAGLHFIPFNYNTANNELEVVTSIKLEIEFSGTDPEFIFNRSKHVAPKFYNMYKASLLNFESMGYTMKFKSNDDIKYLIITNDEAISTIQPFVDWKNQQGMKVEVKTMETGFETPEDFKDYITTLYENDNLEYILMVGDAYPNGGNNGGPNDVPMYWWSPGGDPSFSDSWYTCMDGADDHYADIAIGRLTYDEGELDELELQIQKTMDHYFNPDDETNWAENTILIAHDEQYPAKYTQCCEEIRTFPYALQTPIFEQAYGGAGYNNTQVVDYVNANSCGIFNYRGHGSATELWQWCPQGSFTNQHVNQLTNEDQLFVFFDVCCDNMDIVAHAGDCLCESFMKSDVAAVAANGAIIPSYTIPNHDYDKEMYKAVFNEGIYNIGYVTNYANITVLNVHGDIGKSNVRTYLWLGDASIEPWTLQPANLTVSHDPQLFLGLAEFSVTVLGTGGALENAMVCVSNEDQTVYGVGYTDASGYVEIVFDSPVQDPGTATVTVTAHNHLPYQSDIQVIPQSGPYVIKDTYDLNDDDGGNGDGLMDYGEAILISLGVKNVGITEATNVVVTLSTADPYITFTDDTEPFGSVAPEEIVYIADGFAIDVAADIPDGHFVIIDVEASGDSEDIWTSSFTIEGHAPSLEVGSITIDDSQGGNGNGRLDPGEDANIIIETYNNGSSHAMDAVGTISIVSSFVTVNNETHDFSTLASGSMDEAVFSISVNNATPIGSPISIDYDVTSGEYSAQKTFGVSIGLILEDWETGDMSQYEWETGGNGNWSVVNTGAYEGTYCAKSGDISDSQNTYLELEYDVQSDNVISFWMKVSSEGSYDFLRFYIDGNEQNSWSGDVNWQEVEYPVTGGIHIFKWEYTKDASVSNGSDCAWIDFIILPPSETTTLAASFISDITTSCEQELVHFEDISSGNVVSWNWTFEGGSPATSSFQNPIVVYFNSGTYDVTLSVSDGVESSTITLEEYMTVVSTPQVPATPTGEDEICSNFMLSSEYETTGAIYAEEYTWEILPVEAGTISGDGMVGTVEWTTNWEGTATIKVKGMNEACGEGGFSDDFEVVCSICTGIDEYGDQAGIQVYPNPSNGQFTVKFEKNIGQTNIIVMNMLNEILLEQSTATGNNNSVNFDLSNYAEGVYFVRIKTDSSEQIKKIIVR